VLRAQPLERLIDELARVVAEREVTHVVLGLPLKMDGTEGPAAAEVRKFAEVLRERLKLPVELWDERLTTAQAERAMLDADLSRAKRKLRRDKVAAQILLQSYLDSRRNAPR
jgi:putative Holliday junction resolvase